ncbi:MAG TPA: hypothetical protein VI451_04990 [Anaerolineales bacterium]|nr:hypothetical protein [Anaerolineales bacterium]
MTTYSNDDQMPFLAELDMQEWFVTPGKSTYIPVQLANQGTATKILQLSVSGIPAHWLEMVPEKVVVLPGEQKEVALVVQLPDAPMTKTGRYPIQVTVMQAENDSEKVVLKGTLTVAAYEVQGRIAILMDALHFSVAPGAAVIVNIKLINQGLEEDTFQLAVDGIPAAWVSTATPSLRLRPGEQKPVSILIRPARHFQSRAGRHPFKLRIVSQLNPSEAAVVDCVLTIEAYSEFKSQLIPEKVLIGENVQMVIENSGNIPDSYSLTWASTNQDLGFEWTGDYLSENNPQIDEEGAVKVRIPPGDKAVLHFQPKLQTGLNLIGNLVYPFKVNVEATNSVVQSHAGEVVSRGLIPVWVVQVGIMVLLGTMCLAGFFLARGNLISTQATETALAAIAGSTQTVEFSASQTAAATQTASANMTQAAEAGQEDSDGDGLTNDQEAEFGTDPLLADTDNDGLFDGVEIAGMTNPLNPDTDGDTLTDGDEVQRGTDPRSQDTDTDSLSDGQEIQLGTNPLNPDSDADGLSDGSETPPCPDPLNPDSDNDGLIDGQDFEPCDPNNPSLTETAIAASPTETPVPPAETPTEAPTDVPTELPTEPLEPTSTSEPQIPPLDGVMALISTRDGNPEIYTLHLADNSLTRLTIDPAVEAQPSWSPDGSQIAFATNRDGNFEVYLMNADGTGLVNLTNNGSDDFDPAWSPDGTQIAFASNRDGNNEIYIMNVDGTDPHNVTSNPADDSQPSWFIKGGLLPTVRIAFTSDRDGNQEIYSMNPSGVDQNNLSNNPADDHSPAGLSDLGLIIFTTNRDGNQEVYVMSDDGSSQSNLTHQPAEDWAPTWANAEWVAFVSTRDGNQEIYIVNGDEQYNLTANPADDYDPGWFTP